LVEPWCSSTSGRNIPLALQPRGQL
jgi:hypothetical protein